jgi:adenylate cyclase class IV
MQNVEFKAELRDLPLARTVCRTLKATLIATLEQTDTYYRVPNGRLKKRECVGEPTEFIYYDRQNGSLPKTSEFTIYSESQAQQRFGLKPLPTWIVVKKSRELWMLGGVRIHLDAVDGLGNFIEFEALVSPSQSIPKCHETLIDLREAFSHCLGEPIAGSYSDMLATEGEPEERKPRR